jgi:hypothetical protein
MTTTATTFTSGQEVIAHRADYNDDRDFDAVVVGVSPKGDRMIVRLPVGRTLIIRTEDACTVEEYGDSLEGPTCSICDAAGHGYPGGPPCPLEDRGWMDNDDREHQFRF